MRGSVVGKLQANVFITCSLAGANLHLVFEDMQF